MKLDSIFENQARRLQVTAVLSSCIDYVQGQVFVLFLPSVRHLQGEISLNPITAFSGVRNS